ncbi:complex I NDUFA9 subunit family protein [Thiohalobacter sp. IOR34]|uniref:complex I NDUFA9 subunit family protein n=1 Tax=Thiohalobacter sp. IOR34 TaxID=3057176 RepID=UPI0025B0B125|nr:complex I NDUFA9 subunit family protein [Thiohalobacter sp. IOR34]WJW75367.1 complex I NDUFA9 subunit family protein [Thiohalobacter sp. IOR34]
MAHHRQICVIGGTGFLGRHLCNRLADAGYRVRVPTRRVVRHRELQVHPNIRLEERNVHDPEALRAAIEGCAAVVNLVGILNEDRPGDFRKVHVELPQRIVEACLAGGVPRLLHMSALNAYPREEHSQYLRTKGEGEDLVHAAAAQGLRVTSFRPSVIFGPDDHFFNRFARLLRLSPLLFPLACPDARFAPVYVGDVAAAFHRALEDDSTIGRHCDLCGPRIYRLHELVAYTGQLIGVRPRILRLGNSTSWLQARLLEYLPGTPFSRDNFWSLQKESVCQDNCLLRLGIQPTAVEAVMPRHLAGRSSRGRYQAFRRLAHR